MYLALCLLSGIFYATITNLKSGLLSLTKFFVNCARVVHDSSSTLRMLHSVRRDPSVPSMDPGGPVHLSFFKRLESSVGTPRISCRVCLSSTRLRLISCLSIHRMCEGFCGVHTDCSICVIFGKIGSLTFELGGLVSKLGSTYTLPSQHLCRHPPQLPSSSTKSIGQLQAHNPAFQLVTLARVAD
jgi:hypothetical protein